MANTLKVDEVQPDYGTKIFRTATFSRFHWLAVFGFLALAIMLRVIFFQGYVDSDPAAYASLANDLAHGELHLRTYDGPAIFPLRFGVYAPVAFLIKTFGLSEITLIAFPFLISIAGCFLAYLLARHFFGALAGLISILLLTLLPSDITMASELYPDPIAAFWANIGVGLIIFSYRGNPKWSPVMMILAGLCFGISWLGKETVVYLAPFVAILAYMQQKKLAAAVLQLFYVGLGALFVVVIESAFYQEVVGNWLFHFNTLEKNYVQSSDWFFDQSSPFFGWEPGGYIKALAKRLFFTGPLELLTSFRAVSALAILALAWAAFVKDRRFIVAGIWFAVTMLMFNFCSSSLTSYKPLPLFERYLYPILLPAILLVSGLLAALWEKRARPELMSERKFWAAILAIACLGTYVPAISGIKSRPEQVVRDVIPNLNASDIVYTDFRTAVTLAFLRTGLLLPSSDIVIPYENLNQRDLRIGSYVLINKQKTDFLAASYGYRSPEFVNAPPNTWKKVWSEKRADLFRIE
jgi:4-amino-4-deoxy-L-arabinose transferase-like glycosyltransferase